MSSLKDCIAENIERMWWRQDKPPILLRWISLLYATINKRNLKRRAARCVQAAIPLISVGNITVGGSGKTPFAIWLCAELQQRGYKPVILCRGDGGRLKAPRQVLPGDPASLVGDEALLLAQNANVPVISGRDRVAGSHMAAALGDIVILDDGFQYRQLGRSCDIVLIPDTGPGNGYQLPAGPLREPLSALQRADLIVRTGSLPARTSGNQEWHWQAQAMPIRFLRGDSDAWGEKAFLALAGIARPERFFAAASQAADIREQLRYTDHHAYTPADIARITGAGLPVLTTEKDAVKLIPLWPERHALAVLPLAGRGEEGLPEAIIKTMLGHRQT
ncbi:MAG: tetraacyldisaccharide 4'-kinase [Mariprofundaceae bacterium]|nr:tetraacyldisaccharide 4'-kinase [Mariprofundaceae bacterium]